MAKTDNPRSMLGMATALLGTIVLLVFELAATLAIYTGLNIYSLEVFGALVRFSRGVLDAMTFLIERIMPGSANTAYATLFGELGPKSILLLLLGLTVAALVRLIAGAIRSLSSR